MNQPDLLTPALKNGAQHVVEELMRELRAAQAVVIATEDGFEVCAHAQNTAQVSRLSAMASSMAALGAMAGEESDLGGCASIVVEAERGYLVMMQARHPRATLILSVVAGRDTVMGQALYFCRQAAQALERL
jgi:predicted regulator of Ras-like GTPase activity (Roadblock/LC7/MglB family)